MSDWERWRHKEDAGVVYEARPVEDGYEVKTPGGEPFATLGAEAFEEIYEKEAKDERDG